MIHVQTKLKINDNSGIKLGKCIKIYKSKVGKIGDKILISAKKLRLNQKKKLKIRKGDLFKAFVIIPKNKDDNNEINKVYLSGFQ